MALVLSPTQSAIQTALRSFLLSILPSGVEVIAGQANRVPEPSSPDFVVMTPILRQRLETNTDTFADVSFTASISGTTLDVTAIAYGIIEVGQAVFGESVAAGTIVAALGSGSGGIGTYTVNTSQGVGSEKMASGTEAIRQPTQVTMQIDVHGPNASDNAQTISTLFRDDRATTFFAASGYPVAPFYADDPKQIPFQNAEDQWEFRYVIDAVMQANQLVSNLPQQFADQLDVGLIAVDAAYPA
jgi:hypothetical protein